MVELKLIPYGIKCINAKHLKCSILRDSYSLNILLNVNSVEGYCVGIDVGMC